MARELVVRIVGDAASLQRSLGSAAAATDSFGGRMQAAGAKISSVGRTMTTHLTLPIVGLGAVATKSAVDFQNSMELLHTQAGVSQKAVDSLSKSVLGMAGSVATAPDELSAGLYHLASQGLRGKEALDALRISAEGAKVGGADLESVTNALGATLVSHISGVHSYGQAMGELNAIVGSGDMRMQDLADAMGTGLPANAKIAGVSLQQVGGALATFGDNNIRGAKAGTLLGSTLRIMSAPSHAAQKALASVGISATQLGDTLRSGGLTGAIGLLKEKMETAGLTATQQGLLLTEAFGGRQATGVKILVDEFDRLKSKVKDVSDGGQSFASDWASYTKTTAYHLASMGAQMQSAGVTIGDILLPIVSQLANKIGELANAFNQLSPAQKKLVLIGAGAVAALGPVVSVIGNVTKAVSGVVKTFETIGPAVMKAGSAMADLVAANPVIAGVVAAVAALAIAGYELYTHWNEVRGYLLEVWNAIKAGFETAIHAITGALSAAWHTIRDTAVKVWNEIKDHLGLIAAAVATVILGPIGGLVVLVATHWREILHGAEDAWNLIRNAIGHALDAIKTAIDDAIGWVAKEAVKIGKAIVDGIAKGIGDLGGTLGHLIHSGIHKAWGFVKSMWHIGSPSQVFADTVGLPLAQGIIVGYLDGINGLGGKMSESLRVALEQAKHAIDDYRTQFSQSWSKLVADANTAFEGIQKAAGTMAGNLLASLTAAKNAADFRDQFAQAQQQLASALSTAASGTTDANGNAVQQPQQVAAAFAQLQQAYAAVTAATKSYGAASKQAVDAQKALIAATSSAQLAVNAEPAGAQQSNDQAVITAQQSLNDLLYQQTQAALQKKAALEKKDAAARIAERKKSMDEALAALKVNLEKEHATHAQAQAAILALLKSYGVSYMASGKALGEAFSNGLRASIGDAEKAAQALAAAVAQYLPHSPAEKGPLSKPIGWNSYLLGNLGGTVAAATSLLSSGLAAPPSAGYGAGRGAGTTVNVTVQVPSSFVGSEHELVDAITAAFVRAGNGGHPYWKNLNRLGG